MKEIHFQPDEFPKLALFIKESACYKNQLEEHYVSKISVPVVALSLEYSSKNKVTAAQAKEYWSHVLPKLDQNNIHTIYVADSQYFKTVAKKATTEPHYGYVLPVGIAGYEHINVIYGVNYQALVHNDRLKEKLELSVNTVNKYFSGTYKELGSGVIDSAVYPESVGEVMNVLISMFKKPALTCDIETYGLQLDQAVPATIAFAWDEHNGTAFKLDHELKRQVLKDFLRYYEGELIFHNATYDIRSLIYYLFMDHPLDDEGLLEGLDVLYRRTHDTKLLVYLATNNTNENVLGLKPNAFEFAGNYAKDDINDITKIPEAELLEYNLIDCLSTWYVFNKHMPTVKAEQWDIYTQIFLPSLKNVTHMELVGLPLDMDKVSVLKNKLDDIISTNTNILKNTQYVQDFEWMVKKEEFVAKNQVLKRKFKSLDEFTADFNPSSTNQVARLLHEVMGLPVVDTTDKGAPAVGAKSLKKMLNRLLTENGLTDEDFDTS